MQILDEQQIPRSNYVELKVTTETIFSRSVGLHSKAACFPGGVQSIVSGTPVIVYGIRDYDGRVKSIEHVRN
ncbi:hypothetical protein OS493_036717 [Desmophyllum pertusum]|uniref:RAI1-like domain-containing protein n=1 Tax=Desmophyllum pertusum TaxID=174260 RepID=A0A9W9ZIX5_9CNID|nr:hypothetical protein OS493_036717 [Desmophyllum pertusum]